MRSATNVRAGRLFDGIARAYDAPAEALSFGQYGRWRRYAVRRLGAPPGAFVLDVATGTGLVARDLMRRGFRVAGIDQSEAMLHGAGARGVAVAAACAERLPFDDGTFEALTFTYLLRYVDDPAAVLRELARVLKPGAPVASVEFGVPSGPVTKRLWRLYATVVFPRLAAAISPGWREVGGFLPGSIVEWNRRMPPGAIARMWRDAGFEAVGYRPMSFGAGIVTWGRRRG